MNNESSDYLQDWDNMTQVCTSVATCDGATFSMPYGHYFFFRGTTSESQSYVGFGSGSGGTYWSSENPPKDVYKQCDSNYPGFSNDVCSITLFKSFWSMIE
jgi:hypothetical protein